jgi:hypothetical protein
MVKKGYAPPLSENWVNSGSVRLTHSATYVKRLKPGLTHFPTQA